MPLPMLALVMSVSLTLPVADRVPKLDMRPNCNSVTKDGGGVLGETVDNCMKSEKGARDKLVTTWRQYPAADQRRCTQLTTTGGPPSYVELLTCLEMAQDVRKVPTEGGQARREKASTSRPIPSPTR